MSCGFGESAPENVDNVVMTQININNRNNIPGFKTEKVNKATLNLEINCSS
jgi:hypothetical protein